MIRERHAAKPSGARDSPECARNSRARRARRTPPRFETPADTRAVRSTHSRATTRTGRWARWNCIAGPVVSIPVYIPSGLRNHDDGGPCQRGNGSRRRPSGNTPPRKGSSASINTMSSSRFKRKCWNPSSSRKTSGLQLALHPASDVVAIRTDAHMRCALPNKHLSFVAGLPRVRSSRVEQSRSSAICGRIRASESLDSGPPRPLAGPNGHHRRLPCPAHGERRR